MVNLVPQILVPLRQVGKPLDFDSNMRWFESSRGIHFKNLATHWVAIFLSHAFWRSFVKLVFVATAILLLTSCANQQKRVDVAREQLTSGLIGCPPEEIKIDSKKNVDQWYGTNVAMWEATCRGHKFHCSLHMGAATETFCSKDLEAKK